MSERYASFDDALDAAIDAMRDGQPLSVILASHPAHAANLLPLLEIALSADAAAGAAGVPPSSRLIENYSVVRAAVRRARMALPAEQPASLARPWWQRRLAFASLSLPAGAVAAIVITGASGAAAATVAAARTDIPARVAEAVRSSWVGDLLTGADPSPHSGPTNAAPPATRAAANSTFAASRKRRRRTRSARERRSPSPASSAMFTETHSRSRPATPPGRSPSTAPRASLARSPRELPPPQPARSRPARRCTPIRST